MTLRLLDAFAGVGGFSLAAEWVGWTVAGQIEIDAWCRRVLAKHWPGVPRIGDIREARGDEFGAVDVVVGGFPCQPYSVAGKQRGADDDRALWSEMHRLIAAIRPTYIVAENVPGFIRMGLDDLLADLDRLGYAAWPVVAPAAGVGALHRRDRVWIVACLADAGCDGTAARGECPTPAGAGRSGTTDGGGSRGDSGQKRLGGAGQSAALVADAGCQQQPQEREGAAWDGAADGTGRQLPSLVAAGIGASGGIGAGRHPEGVRLRGELDRIGTAVSTALADAERARPERQSDAAGRHDGDGDAAGWEEGAGWLAERRADVRHADGGDEASLNGACGWPDAESEGARERSRRQTQPGFRRGVDGLSSGLDRARFLDPRWQGDPLQAFGNNFEYDAPLVVAGTIPDRVNRLKALGNAIVPQCAYVIFQAIQSAEEAD